MDLNRNVSFWKLREVEGLELMRARNWSHKFPPHLHETYSIPLVEKGIMGSYYRSAGHYLGPGHFDVVNPGEVHTGYPFEGPCWSYRCFYPSQLFLAEIASQLGRGRSAAPIFSRQINDTKLATRLLLLHHRLQAGNVDLELDTEITETFGMLVMRCSDLQLTLCSDQGEVKPVERVRSFLETYYDRSLRLSQLAEIAGFSPVYLVRAFQKSFGLPPHAYQRQIRISRAKIMLGESHSISDVALQTGFADQSHFTRIFKIVVGVTPGQYVRGL